MQQMEFLLCSMTSLLEVTQGLHNHVWILILIRMLPIVSIAVLLFLFKTTLVPFFLSSFLFPFFFFCHRTFCGQEMEMIRIGAQIPIFLVKISSLRSTANIVRCCRRWFELLSYIAIYSYLQLSFSEFYTCIVQRYSAFIAYIRYLPRTFSNSKIGERTDRLRFKNMMTVNKHLSQQQSNSKPVSPHSNVLRELRHVQALPLLYERETNSPLLFLFNAVVLKRIWLRILIMSNNYA